MDYQILVLDLDGTLTNSDKKISAPTKEALTDIQNQGKKVVLASGRPTYGVTPLAKELELSKYGGYILSYNGACITDCSTGKIIYNKTVPIDILPDLFHIAQQFPADILTYTDEHILSGICSNPYTELESRINHMPVIHADNFPENIHFPVNKYLITGEGSVLAKAEIAVKEKFHKLLNIYRSEPFFLEIMPQNIDKAYSLQKLLNSIGLTADQMICCGDGLNDVTMIEYAGLGVAMENAQPPVRALADYITKSNDEDGILHVINEFMR
ncbi:MAG: Cof-type HAD-IIB family hydrolase [Lachnospiraceae bacterium]